MKNALSEVCPELVSEWSQKNLPLKPDSVTYTHSNGRMVVVAKQLTRR